MVYRVNENGQVVRNQEETYEHPPTVEKYSVDMGDKCSSWQCRVLVALGVLLVVVLLGWGVHSWYSKRGLKNAELDMNAGRYNMGMKMPRSSGSPNRPGFKFY